MAATRVQIDSRERSITGDAGQGKSQDRRHARCGGERQWWGGGSGRFSRRDLARLIGRRIAREHFEAIHAANNNAPEKDAGER